MRRRREGRAGPGPRRTAATALLVALALIPGACSPAPEPPAARDVTVRLAGYAPATADALRAAGWRTDLSRTEVPLSSILLSGAVRREAFVPVRDARFSPAAETDLAAAEPVVVVRSGDGVRGWPLVHLLRRELAVGEAGGRPVAVTFCSLCMTARVWDRRHDGRTLDLRVSGLLHSGNSLLWDRRTGSLWRQADGRGVAGDHAGRALTEVPHVTLSFGALRDARPDALVMRPADGAPDPPFEVMSAGDLARGVPPRWISVVGPDPLALLLDPPGGPVPVAGPRVENRGALVLFRDPGCAAPYRDAAGDAGPVVGSAAVYRREVDGRRLTFVTRADGIADRETGSRWTLLGEAVAGPLRGRRLGIVPARAGFRFARAD